MAGEGLNSLSHLDIFILIKTAIKFATQTPSFTEIETQCFYLLPGDGRRKGGGGGVCAQSRKKETHVVDVLNHPVCLPTGPPPCGASRTVRLGRTFLWRSSSFTKGARLPGDTERLRGM